MNKIEGLIAASFTPLKSNGELNLELVKPHIGEAQKLQLKSMEFVRILIKYGLIPAGKATMRLMGLDLGPSRPPHPNLSEDQIGNLNEELKGIGILGYKV